ncbi:multidrug effflux MFS transporter [Corticibacterium sp. UT-5YL-CI-8]|nr:multidrug effflux MFS transporter [Tianweitania sp. UT-5YL-CI-8]
MDQRSLITPAQPISIPRWEFIALAAALMAVNALAIDIMLPALQQMGDSLGVESENHRQYVISAYFGGMALALLPYGPISDRFGRRGPLLFGLSVYVAAAFAAAFAPNFETLLVLRFIQGAGAASTRVIAISMVRDRYAGRQMAEIMSLVFMVFMVIPVIAPALGQAIMIFSEWHMIFLCMAFVALIITIWAAMRMPETLAQSERRPLTFASIGQAFRMVVTTRVSLCYTLASTLIFGALFGFINSAQQVYVGIYGVGVWFPVIFAAIALMMSLSSFLNSKLVVRVGMRRLSHGAVIGLTIVATVWLALTLVGELPLSLFIGLFALIMFQFGWIGSNFNSLAMEPLGRMAGTASSVQAFFQTFGGAVVGVIIGQAFDGTTTPLAAGYAGLGMLAIVLVLIAERGRLFQPQHEQQTAAH